MSTGWWLSYAILYYYYPATAASTSRESVNEWPNLVVMVGRIVTLLSTG